MMANNHAQKLATKLAGLRQKKDIPEGRQPDGVTLLLDILSQEQTEYDRYTIYQMLITELRINKNFIKALKYAKEMFLEFDDLVSQIDLGKALMDVGLADGALKEYIDAFYRSKSEGDLVNYAYAELMRAAIKASNKSILIEFTKEFLELSPGYSISDCRVEIDWLADAERLGVPPQLLRKLNKHITDGLIN